MEKTVEKIRKNNENLLEKYGSPLYIYDYDILEEMCKQMAGFKNNIENRIGNIKINMHYSTKANSNPAILKIVKDTGLCVDCMSPFELSINKKCGFKNDQILYVCNNIDKNEMNMVYDSNVLICLDSISQVETWGMIHPNTEIMVRINPGTNGVGHNKKVITSGKITKFGITESNLPELFETANRYHLKIIGVHQHLGSLFLDDKITDYIDGVKESLRIIKKYFNNIRIIDLGGGFGVPYYEYENKLDLSKIENELVNVLSKFIYDYPSVEEFKFEPGRFIPCESGILMGTVTAIKYENHVWWIGTDIGMNQLVRPSMYDSYHKVSLLNNTDSEEIIANICGNICESGDIIAKNRKINLPSVGDTILIHNAGAYGYSMASNYTGRLRPAEIMIYDKNEKLIRKRETIEYLESNIVW